MSCCAFSIAHRRNNRCKSFIILQVFVAATLAALFSVPASAQSRRPQQDQPAQSQSAEDVDLINPDRPGIADGSTVISAQTFQIESGIQEEFRRSGDGREHTFLVPMLPRFGIDSHWEARIEGNTLTRVTTFDTANTTNHTSGFAPISMGFKYHIYNSNGDHQISLGTIVRIFPAWGSKEFRMQHLTGDIRLAIGGKEKRKRKDLESVAGNVCERPVPPYNVAIIYVGLGDKDQVFAWLERAYADRSFYLTWLKYDPQLDSLRSDPRFADLLRRVGLPQ